MDVDGRSGRDPLPVRRHRPGKFASAGFPFSELVQIRVLDPAGNVLATAINEAAGSDAAVAGLQLPKAGTYRIQISTPASQAMSTGSYLLSVWDAGIVTQPLVPGRSYTSRLTSLYGADRWTFSGVANQQIEFDLVGASAGNVRFALTGPNGYSVELSGHSDLITLPASGPYTMSASLAGGQAGVAYTFRLVQTQQADLVLGTPYQGTSPGSGSAQLFRVTVDQAMPILVTLSDPAHGRPQRDVHQAWIASHAR